MNDIDKPPPLVLGVKGIEPKPLVMGDTMSEPRPNWQHLAALPPFQMFAAEAAGEAGLPHDAFHFALMFARQEIGHIGERALWERYADWFAAKGLWRSETPDGRAL